MAAKQVGHIINNPSIMTPKVTSANNSKPITPFGYGSKAGRTHSVEMSINTHSLINPPTRTPIQTHTHTPILSSRSISTSYQPTPCQPTPCQHTLTAHPLCAPSQCTISMHPNGHELTLSTQSSLTHTLTHPLTHPLTHSYPMYPSTPTGSRSASQAASRFPSPRADKGDQGERVLSYRILSIH